MQNATSSATAPATNAAGVMVKTAIAAGLISHNHAEGIVVQTTIAAGGRYLNHCETLVGA